MVWTLGREPRWRAGSRDPAQEALGLQGEGQGAGQGPSYPVGEPPGGLSPEPGCCFPLLVPANSTKPRFAPGSPDPAAPSSEKPGPAAGRGGQASRGFSVDEGVRPTCLATADTCAQAHAHPCAHAQAVPPPEGSLALLPDCTWELAPRAKESWQVGRKPVGLM